MARLEATPSFRKRPTLFDISFFKICGLASVGLLAVWTVGCNAAGMGGPAGTQTSPGQTVAQAIQIEANLQPGKITNPYNAVLSVSGGRAPYQLALAGGALPSGVRLSNQTGVISGTPATSGSYQFLVRAIDAAGQVGSKWLQLQIVEGESHITLALTPSSVTLAPNATQQFTATVQGTSNTAVTWTATAGSITGNGLFTAPEPTLSALVRVTATSVADPTQHASSVVTIARPSALSIATTALPGGEVNSPYDASLSANGGTPPYLWNVASGTLPSGIQLSATSGILSGTANQQGQFPFTAKVTDSANNTATEGFVLAVGAPTSGNFDGPAELPRVYIQSSMADTPAPGTTISVAAGGDLQGALNSASCGDTVQLQPGATFSGQFILPAVSCDDQHWIIVRTAVADSSLPPEGTRMTPCFAGVASLPGRPSFSCTAPQRVLATLTYAGTGNGPILFAQGANHYRLLGLEVTRVVGGSSVTSLISVQQQGAADHIVLDRLYIHGTAKDETRRGVQLDGGTNVAVQDSYISDFHCATNGSCTDSQAVGGGNGSLPMGPYKIVNNFLEAAGENIIFGGGAATQTPADIEIRRNHFFKPLSWMQGSPTFSGMVAIVKNHLELKNAQRVLVDSNIMENAWGGFSQKGFSILLTPKNQNDNGTGVCPDCQVTDVTIRYATISHVAAGFQIANVLSPAGAAPLQGQRYSIHDVIVDDIDGQTYVGPGVLAQISTIAQPLLQQVSIQHVTAFPANTLLSVGGPNTVKMPGFIFANNIVTSGTYPIWSTGAFGSQGCAYYDRPLTTMNTCFAAYVFGHNAIVNAPSAFPAAIWPTDNLFLPSSALQFANFSNGNGGDYHLLPGSPAKGAASDGTDMGANVDTVLNAIAGVQ